MLLILRHTCKGGPSNTKYGVSQNKDDRYRLPPTIWLKFGRTHQAFLHPNMSRLWASWVILTTSRFFPEKSELPLKPFQWLKCSISLVRSFTFKVKSWQQLIPKTIKLQRGLSAKPPERLAGMLATSIGKQGGR